MARKNLDREEEEEEEEGEVVKNVNGFGNGESVGPKWPTTIDSASNVSASSFSLPESRKSASGFSSIPLRTPAYKICICPKIIII